MSYDFTIEAGKALRFPTQGKLCDRDIVVTAEGGDSGSDAEKYFEEQYAEVVLPNVKKIKKNAFYSDGILINIQMPNVTSIGKYAFYSCTNLALTSLPAGVTSIGGSAFQHCPNLALTSLPNGLTKIDSYAFRGCKKLTLTSLPSSLTEISSYAFHSCTGLTSITFKGKPTTLFSNSFTDCSNLTTINVPWAEGEVANAPWGATNATINYNYTGE